MYIGSIVKCTKPSLLVTALFVLSKTYLLLSSTNNEYRITVTSNETAMLCPALILVL
jgi:hypothetical protein